MKTIITCITLLCSFSLVKAQNFADSSSIDLEFETITDAEFEKYTVQYHQKQNIGSIKSFESLGLLVKDTCYEVCETHLEDVKTGEKLWLPASFDQGILGMSFSPDGNYLMVCSSYDGPDYSNYYSYRAEIVLYKITTDEGLKAVKHFGDYYSLEWSISDFVWINKGTFALKIYEGHKRGNGVEGGYRYLKASIDYHY